MIEEVIVISLILGSASFLAWFAYKKWQPKIEEGRRRERKEVQKVRCN
ncbi:MAG: hypothetical protein QXU32_03860 [Nitrososphaerales archaeon]